MSPSESELLLLLAIDLYRYFPQVVVRYQQRLYAFARRLTGSAQEAEDIVQEAFVSAYVSLENYPPQRVRTLKLQAWLYRITLYVYSHATRQARLHIVPLDTTDESSLLEIEDPYEERPDIISEKLESQQELEQLVSRLPERYRIAITCYYFEHLTYQEIADLLEQPLGTVKSTVSRGLRLLRSMLASSATTGKEYASWSITNPNSKSR